MKYRHLTIVLALAVPALGSAQLSIFDAAYRIEANAFCGADSDLHSAFSNSVGPQQSFFDRVDSFANEATSAVHSYASVDWNCTPTDLDVELVACWDSFDDGAGNRGHMLSRLFLGFSLAAVNIVSTTAAFDPPNSTMAIDIWGNGTWVQMLGGAQLVNYTGVWGPGDYRLRTQRLYDPVGDSTGCEAYGFHLHAEPVPEPATVLSVGVGLAVLLRRRRRGPKIA